MKKFINLILLVSLIVFSCTACSNDELYDNGYDYGYEVGYDTGLTEGWDSCNEEISNNVAASFGDMKDEACKYGWHPEEALVVLESYLYNKPFYKDGSCATKNDAESALDVLSSYYYGTLECLNKTLGIDVY